MFACSESNPDYCFNAAACEDSSKTQDLEDCNDPFWDPFFRQVKHKECNTDMVEKGLIANCTIESEDCNNVPSLEVRRQLEAKDVKRLYEANQKRLDLNDNGFISMKEIRAAVEDPDLHGEDAQLVAVLSTYHEAFRFLRLGPLTFNFGGISARDIEKFDKAVKAGKDEKRLYLTSLIKAVDRTFSLYCDIEECVDRDLYASNPETSISGAAIAQGSIGDCYFLAPLAATADANWQKIRDMIKDNGDNTYTVTFPALPDKPITVNAPTDVELLRFNAGGEHGTWPSVIEKAFGKLLGGENAEILDGGGDPRNGLKALNDGSSHYESLQRTSDSELHQDLEKAISERRPVICSTGHRDFNSLVKGDKIAPTHAYSVLDYDPNTYTVTVRNPWGRVEPENADGRIKDGLDDGVFKMSLREFKHSFSLVYYQDKPKT